MDEFVIAARTTCSVNVSLATEATNAASATTITTAIPKFLTVHVIRATAMETLTFQWRAIATAQPAIVSDVCTTRRASIANAAGTATGRMTPGEEAKRSSAETFSINAVIRIIHMNSSIIQCVRFLVIRTGRRNRTDLNIFASVADVSNAHVTIWAPVQLSATRILDFVTVIQM